MMKRVELVSRVGDRVVSIGDVYEHDPKWFSHRQKRLHREYADHTSTVEIVAGVAAFAFFVLCIVVYLKTGGIR